MEKKGGNQMKELTYFYLQTCPYCRKADQLIAELQAQEPRFREISFRKIEEREEKALADSYDYYFVPCFWIGEEKLFEGAPEKEDIRKVLERALKG